MAGAAEARQPALMARALAGVAFLVLALALVASRLPFLPNTLLGEEGMFAALVIHPTPSSTQVANGLPQQLVGQIDGSPIYRGFEHPIIPYLVMERGIGVLGRAAHVLERDFATRNVVARGCFFALFTLGVLGLLWRAAAAWVDPRAEGPKFVIPAVVLYVLTTPLLLGASIQPQVDGSYGVMLMGLAAFVLVAGQRRGFETAAFLIAGILVGLGRIEWVMAFAVAALVVFVAQVAFVTRAPFYLPLVFVVGLAAGSAVSYLASPPDYLAGLRLMHGIGRTSDGSFLAVRQQGILLAPALLLAAIAGVSCVLRRRSLLTEASGTLILTLGGILVIAGFAASNWWGDGFPRYYAPATVALAFVVADLAGRASWSSLGRIAAGALVLVGLWFNAHFAHARVTQGASITSYPGAGLKALREQMAFSAELARAENAIMFENASIWIYYPDVNFVGRDLGLEGPGGAKALLAARNPADVARLRVP